MRLLLIVMLVLCLVGCGAPPPLPSSPPPQDTVRKTDQVSVAAAKTQFSAFLDEATRGVQLLESHPGRDAIRGMVNSLHTLLLTACEASPSHEKMAALAEDGRLMMRYFDACLEIANFQTERVQQKQITSERAQHFMDKTCQSNARVIRQLIDIMGRKLAS